MIRIKSINLNGRFTEGRAAILSHNDLDGVAAATILRVSLESLGLDTMIVVDIDPKSEKTDMMVENVLESINAAGLNIFNKVYILDRAAPSIQMINKLVRLGVKEIVHIDHHLSNKNTSEYIERTVVEFTSVFCSNEANYSATWLTYQYVKNVLAENIGNEARMLAKGLSIIVDSWDTFKWTRCVTEDDLFGIGFATEEYSLDSTECEYLTDKLGLFPLDTKSKALNYISKFEDAAYLGEMFKKVISYGEIEALRNYDVVTRKYREMEDKNHMYMQYAYNDAVRGRLTNKSRFRKFDLPYRGEIKTFRVLFIDKALDFEVSSISAHTFLQNYKELIIVYKHKDLSPVYSVRSVGDIPAVEVAKIFGGGGHLNACGFTLSEVNDVLYPLKDRIESIFDSKANIKI
ncbi:MAG: DHH family phosphoesterase [Paraclostridium sp.]